MSECVTCFGWTSEVVVIFERSNIFMELMKMTLKMRTTIKKKVVLINEVFLIF